MSGLRPLSLGLAAGVHALLLVLAWTAFEFHEQRMDFPRPALVAMSLRTPLPSPPRPPAATQMKARVAPSPITKTVTAWRADMPVVVSAMAPIGMTEPVAWGSGDYAPALEVSSGTGSPANAMEPEQGPGAGPGGPSAAPDMRSGRSGDSYAGRVFAWIARHKGYPREMARKGRQGTVLVRLAIDEGGRLAAAELVRSSGHASLDDLALRQIREAMPYPRPPRGLAADGRTFLVPMTYRMEG